MLSTLKIAVSSNRGGQNRKLCMNHRSLAISRCGPPSKDPTIRHSFKASDCYWATKKLELAGASRFISSCAFKASYRLHSRRGCLPLPLRRSFATTRSKQTYPNRNKTHSDAKRHAIRRNKAIVNLGRQQEWKNILALYEKESSQFNNVNYATAISQLKKIRSFDKRHPSFIKFIDCLAELLLTEGIDWIGFRELANIVHSIGKMQIQSRGASKIMAFVATNANAYMKRGQVSPREVSNVCWGMAKLVDDTNLDRFLQGVQESFSSADIFHSNQRSLQEWLHADTPEVTPQTISNTAWACATCDVHLPDIFQVIENRSKWLVEQGNPQAIANTAWACATLGETSPNFFSEVERHATWLVSNGKPQAIANTVWSFAKLRIPATNLCFEIERHADLFLQTARPEAIASVSWAFGTLGEKECNQLFAGIEKRSALLVDRGNTQAITNTVWAFATLGIPAPRLVANMERRAAWLVGTAIPLSVSQLAVACAKLDVTAPKIFSEIDKHAAKFVKEEADAQVAANLAWACAKLGSYLPNLFIAIENRSAWLIDNGNPQAVANLMWASAKFGVFSPLLFQNVERRSAWIVEEGAIQAVSMIAHSYATLGIPAKDFFQSLVTSIPTRLEECSRQQICNICYALSILDHAKDNEPIFHELWSKALSWDTETLTLEQSTQLALTYAFAIASGITLEGSRTNLADPGQPSESHREISSLLDELGYEHEIEVSPLVGEKFSFIPEGVLGIDIASREKMVAIEFDGPYHFVRSVESREAVVNENGATRAKRRFLERLGWHVVNIRYYDWDELDGQGKEAKKEWLRKLLASIA